MLTITLLGGFYAELDGSPLSGFATDKARALLAYLAVERARPHRRESLAALFWPDQSEERARQSLRQALSNLRQVLGEAQTPHFLQITSNDIQISPAADLGSDVQDFKRLVAESKQHNHQAIETCLPCLRRRQQAARLYNGDFLAHFSLPDSQPFEEWQTLTRENLQIEAMQIIASLADYEEKRHNFSAARQYVLQLVHLEPWREEAHAQAMRLLAYEGQRSAALSQYAACRRALKNELGLEPTHSTQSLARAIQEDRLAAPPQVPLPPEPPASFVGREKEQNELAERLAAPNTRLVTLLGPGGIGKTRLALHVARAHAGLYPDGIFFIPLAGIRDCAAALLAIANKIGLTPLPGSDLRQSLCNHLSGRKMLLVLDNLEQLARECQLLSDLFRCAAESKWLVTSREALRLREEWVYPLDGLPVTDSPQPGSPDDEPPPPAALALFAERAAQVDRHFTLNPATRPAVFQICQALEGLPLGVELAAAAVALKPLDELAAALRAVHGPPGLDQLDHPLRNLPERHASLRTVFEHSWNLLSPEEQARLANLSVFVGGFSAEAAQEVAGASAAQLSDLAAKSLLRRDEDGRYSLHESIRQFAAEKLSDAQAVRKRHAACYARFAAQLKEAENAKALDALQAERANLRAAWEWSQVEDVSLTASLLPGLSLLYTLRGPLSEGEELFRGALTQLALPSPAKHQISLELARLYIAQTRYEQAIALAHSGPETAYSLLVEGQALSAQGEAEAARPVLEQALTLAVDDKRIRADCLRELGNIANRQADYERAVPLYQQALELARELGDRRGESATLNNWASIEWELGDLPAARAHYEQALALYRQLGNRLGEAKALNNLSNVLANQGDLNGSLTFSQQAMEIHREMGNPRGQCAALQNLGATYFVLKDYQAARSSYLAALSLYRESGNHQAEAEVLADLSLLDGALGRLEEGREHARAAIALSEQAGDKTNLANALYYLGRIELADRDFPAAEAALTQALDLRQEAAPNPGRLAEIQAELALLAFEQGQLRLARERIAPVLEALDVLEGAEEPERVRELVKKIGQFA